MALKPDSGVSTEDLKERLGTSSRVGTGNHRGLRTRRYREPGHELWSIHADRGAVWGADFGASRKYAEHLRGKIAEISSLSDVQFAQLLAYPSLNIQVDRERAGQLGVTVEDVGRSLVAATSSTRFTQPLYWAAPNGVSYQVQVEIP